MAFNFFCGFPGYKPVLPGSFKICVLVLCREHPKAHRKLFNGEAGNRTCDPWFTRHRAYPLHHGSFLKWHLPCQSTLRDMCYAIFADILFTYLFINCLLVYLFLFLFLSFVFDLSLTLFPIYINLFSTSKVVYIYYLVKQISYSYIVLWCVVHVMSIYCSIKV